jgi:hypothetical protein
MSEMRVRQIHEWFAKFDAVLGESEAVRYVCLASKDLERGLFAVTNSRLLWVTKKSVWSIKAENISSVASEAGTIRSSMSSLTIEAAGIKHEFSEMESACAQDVVLLVGPEKLGGVALGAPEVAVSAPKPIQPMGALGLLTTVMAFVGGAFIVVPWLRGIEDLPLTAWPIAAVVLFFAAGMLGAMFDVVARTFMNGLR